MEIYFSCSVTGGRNEEAVYQALVERMLALGHTVPTAHLSDPQIMAMEAATDAREVYLRDMRWLEACDAVVAEVTTPSHGVGYEIAMALALKKPVLCCYRKGRRVSKIITGNNSETLTLYEYSTEAELLQRVEGFLGSLTK